MDEWTKIKATKEASEKEVNEIVDKIDEIVDEENGESLENEMLELVRELPEVVQKKVQNIMTVCKEKNEKAETAAEERENIRKLKDEDFEQDKLTEIELKRFLEKKLSTGVKAEIKHLNESKRKLLQEYDSRNEDIHSMEKRLAENEKFRDDLKTAEEDIIDDHLDEYDANKLLKVRSTVEKYRNGINQNITMIDNLNIERAQLSAIDYDLKKQERILMEKEQTSVVVEKLKGVIEIKAKNKEKILEKDEQLRDLDLEHEQNKIFVEDAVKEENKLVKKMPEIGQSKYQQLAAEKVQYIHKVSDAEERVNGLLALQEDVTKQINDMDENEEVLIENKLIGFDKQTFKNMKKIDKDNKEMAKKREKEMLKWKKNLQPFQLFQRYVL